MLTRRRILSASAALTGAPLFAALRPRSRRAPLAEDIHASQFPLGIQSYSLRKFNVEQTLERVTELGLSVVEFYPGHFPPSDPGAIRDFKKLVRRHSVSLSAYGVVEFTRDHDANRKWFDLANDLGIKNLSADPTSDSFGSLDELVAEYGIRIAIHNHGPGHRYDKIADVARAVKDHHPWVGACVDTGHFIRSAEDPVKALRELGPRVFGVHLKDFDGQSGDARGTILGEGQLDVDGCMRALQAIHFPMDGALSVEYEESPDNPMTDLQRCVMIAREAAERVSKH
jgi:sugar phosphate isomerase/epimerase